MLKEVQISDVHQPHAFFKDDKYAVLDYHVGQGLIFLLVYKFRRARSELICQTLSGDTLLAPCPIHFKPTGLYHDCLGNLHVLSKDSIYQVYLGNEIISLIYEYDIERFESSLVNCMIATEDAMYFRKQSPDRLSVDFLKVDRHSRQRQLFASTKDEVMGKVLRENPSDYAYLISDRIPDGRENLVEYIWVRKILYKPNRSMMHRMGDSLFVFNLSDTTVEVYDLQGQLIDMISLADVGKIEGTWTLDVYIDPATRQAYTSGIKNGIVTLYQIDLDRGELHRVMSTVHTFPEKLSIYNQNLFYLYDLPGEADNKQLLRQRL
jgi:hypothetical protein